MRREVVVLAASAALLLSGCQAEGQDAGPSPSTTSPDLDAIRRAREAYAEPATALGTLARQVQADVRALRLEVPPSGPDGAPDDDGRTFLVDQAMGAVDDLTSLLEDPVPVPGDDAQEPAITAAGTAWKMATQAAADLAAAATAEVELAARLLEVEQRLADTAALWDQPGSRAEQTQRLDEAADEAEAHAASLADLVDEPACATAAARRVAAAELVAERTRELHGYVSRGQGRSFDEARASFDESPWHVGLVDLDASEEACWEQASDVVDRADEVIAALARLVEALNTGVAPGEADATDLPSTDTTSG